MGYVSKEEQRKVCRRSLYRLLQKIHERAPSIQVLHRTLEEPFIKINAQVDMRAAGPHQTVIPLANGGMAEVYWNKKHRTGGTYLELGGSNLLPKKTVGNFVPEVGVNACLLRQ